MARTMKALLPVALVGLTLACGTSEHAPLAPSNATTVSDSSDAAHPLAALSADLASCLAAPSPLCFRSSSIGASRVASAAVDAPLGLTASVVGSTVNLSWTAPSSAVSGYVIEAGSAPGSADLASFPTTNTRTSYSASGVPVGT